VKGVLGSSGNPHNFDVVCKPQTQGQIPQSFDDLSAAVEQLERQAGDLVSSLEYVLSEQVMKAGESIERGYSCSVAHGIGEAASRIRRVVALIQETRDRLEL